MPKKLCRRCDTVKPFTEFYKNANRPGGIQSHCKKCHKETVKTYQKRCPEKCKESMTKWRTKNRVQYRAYTREYQRKHALRLRLKKYGLTLDEYRKLHDKHDGRCHICKQEPDERLHIDHCHDTGRVRGLLCNGCNTTLGLVRDNVHILNAAIQYLRT